MLVLDLELVLMLVQHQVANWDANMVAINLTTCHWLQVQTVNDWFKVKMMALKHLDDLFKHALAITNVKHLEQA